jgi:2-isopropylmalate synthase
LPKWVGILTKIARARFRNVGIHTHNDIGLGVANAMAAIDEGAMHVQGTVNGYGERTGNCDLTSVIPILSIKMGKETVLPESLARLRELSMFVDSVANMAHNPRQPWVGSGAFSHKGGGHVDAVRKAAASYEHIDPALVGNVRNILVSELSGRSNILLKARELGFVLPDNGPEISEILRQVKSFEHKGYEYEVASASLALLIHYALKPDDLFFNVQDYHVSMRGNGKSSINEATVRVSVGNEKHHEVGDGDGPVNALDCALRRALVKSFPHLNKVKLTDYKVRILDGVDGSASKTRVLITSTDGRRDWTTVGVSGNIIEASFLALSDSFEFALLPHK